MPINGSAVLEFWHANSRDDRRTARVANLMSVGFGAKEMESAITAALTTDLRSGPNDAASGAFQWSP